MEGGALVHQVAGRQFAHLAGADDEDIRRAQIIDDLHGQVDGRGRHGNTAVGDMGLGADLFARRDGWLKMVLKTVDVLPALRAR